MKQVRPFVGGRFADGDRTVPLTDKFSGEEIAAVHTLDHPRVTEATQAVAEAQRTQGLSHYRRYEVLTRTARLLEQDRDRAIRTIVADTGFTLADAAREADRTVQTLLLSGEEAKRVHGEMVPFHGAPNGAGRLAFTVRRPIGVVCAITPFNSPLNTVAHKVGPALAAGNGVVLKPAAATPMSAELLLELLLAAGLPPELMAVVHGEGGQIGRWLTEDPVPGFYAFTGSSEVGEAIRRTVGLRRSQLELGSISSTLVCADADLDKAVASVADAAFRKAGQVCTSAQRLYVHASVAREVQDRLLTLLAGTKAGNPLDEDVTVGPVISTGSADRIESWITSATRSGAELLAGGGREGNVIEPTLLAGVTPEMEVMCSEVFGPVLSLRPYTDFASAVAEANATPYGLSAGVFTSDITTALQAAQDLHMGSVHINATSSNRVDLMPYSGVKRSGLGKEGPKYAVEEMTEEHLVTIAGP